MSEQRFDIQYIGRSPALGHRPQTWEPLSGGINLDKVELDTQWSSLQPLSVYETLLFRIIDSDTGEIVNVGNSE